MSRTRGPRSSGGEMRCRFPRFTTLRIMLLLIAGVLALALAGCGGGTDQSAASSSPSAASGGVSVAGVAIAPDAQIAGMVPEAIKSAGTLRVAMNIPYPPWEMYVEVGGDEVTGLDYDLAVALAAKMGLKVAVSQMPFDSIIPAIQAGKADTVLSAMYDSKEREEVLDFVDYAVDATGILVPAGNPQGITGMNDLGGKAVAVVSGSTQAKLLASLAPKLKAAGKPIEIVALPNSSDLLLALSSGKVQASLGDLSSAEYAAKTYEGGNAFEVVNDPANPVEPGVVGAGVLKSNRQLTDALQAALQSLIDDGTYAKILDKYGLASLAVESAEINKPSF